MSIGDVDKRRRRLLVGATSVVGGIGMVGAAVPFVALMESQCQSKGSRCPGKGEHQ